MENSLRSKKTRIASTISELESSVGAVEKVNTEDSIELDFELGDTLYAKGTVRNGPKAVGLWLGAGVMLEYPVEEAKAFLNTKLEDRADELLKCNHDLDFVRRQITTMEVNVARLYNHAVSLKKKNNN